MTDVALTLHYPHDTQPPRWNEPYYQVCGIDPAVKHNLCFWVSRRYLSGPVVPYLAGHMGFEEAAQSSPTVWLTRFFESFISIFSQCHIILIERQDGKDNTPVKLVAQHIKSHLCVRLRNNPLRTLIYEVSPKLKTSTFSLAEEKVSGSNVKPWALHFVDNLLRARNDQKSLEIISSFPRPQDACDVLAMIEAFFKHTGLPTRLREENWIYFSKLSISRLPPPKPKSKNGWRRSGFKGRRAT